MNSAYGDTRLARRLVWFFSILDVVLLFSVSCGAMAGGSGWLIVLLPLAVVTAVVGVYAVRQGLIFEWRVERIWKRVCHGVGFKGESASILRSVRAGVASRGKYYVATQTKTVYPDLRNVYGNWQGWSGTVRFFDGQTIEDYTKQADAFALAFHVPFVTFDLADNGLISVRAGNVPVPEAYDHPGRLDTREQQLLPAPVRSLDIADQPTQPLVAVRDLSYELKLLNGVPVARDLNGRTYRIPIVGQHWLIAAKTGGGKGSWLWSLVLGLAPAWRAGLVKFWGCDPKRLELAIGREWWGHYADNEADIVSMLEQCVSEMLTRAVQLQGKVRKFSPSPDTPLNVIVVDELGYLSAMLPDRKLRERAEKAVSTIVALGRAVGYSLVGAVQDPRKETVGFRDLFPIRIAGSLPAPMVDLVLGEGMHDAGAVCEQIPLGDAGAGVAFVISEATLRPVCVRAAWCDDAVIRQALMGEPVRTAISRGYQGAREERLSGQSDGNERSPQQLRYQPE